MTTRNFSQPPYFDDFSETKKFHKILFRPGRAVQARELNQIQSLLQTQIDRMGKHFFENGAQVLPGSTEGVKYINNNGYIKVPALDTYFTDTVQKIETYWMGKTLISTTDPLNIRATVIGYSNIVGGEVRLYLNYLTADDQTGTTQTFSSGQKLVDESTISQYLLVSTQGQFTTGQISSVVVEEGVYFYNGNFVLVDKQTHFITPSSTNVGLDSAWNNNPTAVVGLKFSESIVTWQDDDSLLDNATGTPNIGAPGADRQYISADLIQIDLNSDETNFVPLVKVVDGTVQKRVVRTEYSVIEDTLARRTNDESGDYTVIPFQIQIKDFLNDQTNNGVHLEEEFYYDTEDDAREAGANIFGLVGTEASPIPVTTLGGTESPSAVSGKIVPGTSYNTSGEENSFIALCKKRLSIRIDPGKAYVQGYEIEKLSTSVVDVERARSKKFRNNKTVSTPLGEFLYVKDMFGALDTVNYQKVELHSKPIATKGTSPSAKIGTARVIRVEFYSGFKESTNDTRSYRMFLIDIKIDSGYNIEQVRSIYAAPTANSTSFTCSCVLNSFRLVGSITKPVVVSRSATTASGSKILTGLSSTSDLYVDMVVTGTGIAANSKIVSITSSTSVTLNNNATASATNTLTFTPTGILLGTGTSWKNDETQRLSAGDLIQVGSGATAKQYLVGKNPETDFQLYVTQPSGADATTHTETWVNGSTIDFLFNIVNSNSPSPALLYKLPDDFVATVRSADSNGNINYADSGIDTVYTTRKTYYNVQASLESGIYQISQSFAAEENKSFEDFGFDSYYVQIISHADAGSEKSGMWMQVLPYSSGQPPVGSVYVQTLGTQLKLYFNTADAIHSGTPTTFQILASVISSGGIASKEKSKVLQIGSYSSGEWTGGGVAVSAGADVSEISLGFPDVLRIRRIVEGPNYSDAPSSLKNLPSTNKDITGLYILDNGQRDTHYDIAKVYLRPGATRPRGKVRVEFDYFTHTGSGDYFSVDSYPIGNGTGTPVIEYDDIPDYTAKDGTLYDLTSCLDFRPVVNAGGIDAGFATTLNPPVENFTCDYHFYESRKDKLFLDKTGKFLIKSGVPDKNSVLPEDPDTGMVIYELEFAPYTSTPQNVFARLRDNKRYTMRDIGKLEKRIKNLEYYTSLTLLEKDTNTMLVKDAAGNDRFKNGFLVDNFTTFGSSDLGSADFRASIEKSSGILRPLIQQDNVGLFERALLINGEFNRNSYRSGKKYQKTGDIFHLPILENVTMLEQTKASKTSNINPYAVFTYVGSVSISPWSDEWRDVRTADPLNVQDQSQWEASRQSFGPSGTTIDYEMTFNNWTSLEISEPKRTGKGVLETAGHAILDRLPESERRRAKKNGQVRVPEGYANAGQLVPISGRSWVAPQLRTTTTLSGQEITTSMTSTFVDKGFSSPISLGSRIIDTSLIEYMRSRDITFTAKGFMPYARLYPFFDDVNVSAECKPQGGVLGAPLICDSRGRLTGTFTIPNRDDKKFKTGDRIFRLTTSPTNQLVPAPSSAGEGRYTARGWIDTKQETTLSTRLFTVDKNTTSSSRDIVQTANSFTQGEAVPRDPIAQSFFVYDKGGCYITYVDIFFAKRPTGATQPPVTLQIRPLGDEGFPSKTILPFGEVIKEAIEVITNKVDLANRTMTVTGYDGSDPLIPATLQNTGPWTNGEGVVGGEVISNTAFTLPESPSSKMVPTRFTFESPIFLSENQSYAIVLIADTTEYEVWVSQSGPDTENPDGDTNVEIGTNTPILKDPYIQGIFFKSQNGLSWTPDQTVDMKFKIWKAKFDTAVTGEIDFVNESLPVKTLTLDPFEFKNGSSKIRILHPNHGLTTARAGSLASRVVFSPRYDLVLTGALTTTSGSTTVSTTTNFNQIPNGVTGAFIKHPVTGEQKRITTTMTSGLTSVTIDSPFTLQQLSSTTGVLATSYAVPHNSNLGGLSSTTLFDFRGHEVTRTEMDYYIIEVDDVFTAISGRFGGTGVTATENKRFEELMLLTTPLSLPETALNWTIQTTTSCGIHDAATSTYNVVPSITFQPNQKVVFDNPMQVSSYINETPTTGGAILNGPSKAPENVATSSPTYSDRKSLVIKAVLKSTNPNLTPIVDVSRMSAFLISNRLDNPRGIVSSDAPASVVVNDDFDNYTCLPTQAGITPAVTSAQTQNAIYFTSTTGQISGISGTAGSRTLTGGISFLSDLRVGDVIKTPQNEERVVESIISNSELLLTMAIGTSFTNGTLYIRPQNLKFKTGNADIAKNLSNLDIGKYLTLTGATGTRNFTDAMILSIDYSPNNTVDDVNLLAAAGGVSGPTTKKLIEVEVNYRTYQAAGMEANAITFVQKDRYIDEIAPEGGSCSAKYVSKKLTVSRPSNAIKVMFDASRNELCELELYYRTQPPSSAVEIDDVNWIKAEFNLEDGAVLVPATPAPNSSTDEYSAYESTINGIPSFTSAQAKLVMRGGNPARSPMIKNFRMIVLDE